MFCKLKSQTGSLQLNSAEHSFSISKKLRSEAGIGLISVVAAAFIVAISIAGLFVASHVTRFKALEVFHYRVALLKGLQKIEEIKFQNRLNVETEPVNIDGIGSEEFYLDELDGVTLKGKVHAPSITHHSDVVVSQFARYHKVIVKVTWYDGPRYYFNKVLNKQKQLILREDYFYRASDVGQ
ncbi:MAG: hypothetical protein K9N09_08630 [Candidatus Cloacimonetes bacterium]|nr:hypothetical protein [Candidatus Cloacimonadota bacterium]MCF7814151.1 hypothetical protein [Candidatus Cloacimonadota bacterium]MCF7868750.1 hypothetical protein [Candidatus Cloacimonadota bacterium]MCF7884150.1 hypothetical protein [Candidatus Cloacimonadota bacterium]